MNHTNHTDELSARLEAKGTYWRNATTMTALGLTLLIIQYQHKPILNSNLSNSPSFVSMPDTFQITRQGENVSYLDLFDAINNVYNQLLSDQVELDMESKNILYTNLWDLYN